MILDEKIKINLGPVQEILLIPLLGRAMQTQKQTGLIDGGLSRDLERFQSKFDV